MKWHKFSEERPEGNVYNPYAFLIRTPNEYASGDFNKYVYDIGYWEDGHWSHGVEGLEDIEWICIDTELK